MAYSSVTNLDVMEELIFAAVSSNRNEKNLSCHDDYLLYSRSRCPIIYSLSQERLLARLAGHNDEINGQCFIVEQDRVNSQDLHVISTAHDNSAIIWRISDLNAINQVEYQILYHIKSPDDSIFQTRCSWKLNHDIFLSILTTIEGNIYFFKNDHLIQTIASNICFFDARFHFCDYIHLDNEKQPVQCRFLSLAGSDNKVHIYLIQNSEELVHLLDLAGFNDWIKCLDFLPLAGRDNEFLLAAACQDSLIQVWHLRLTSLPVDITSRVRTNVSKPLCFQGETSDVRLTATLETVLSGHESFVYGLSWFKKSRDDLLQLISCSADRTIIIWQSAVSKRNESASQQKYEQYPASEGVWKQTVQLGETGETNMPFLGVCLSEDEKTIFGQSYRGAIHVWNLDDSEGSKISWKPRHSISGHFDAVTDIVWSHSGEYLLSASLDKTCRLYGISHQDNKWHELARPQVHGFEINCLAPLSSIKFASGAEEKTIRTFEATQFFVKNFDSLTRTQLSLDDCHTDNHPAKLEDLPAHAQLPALGLSNRGAQFAFDVYGGEDRATDNNVKTSHQSGDKNASGKPTINLSDNNSWHEVSELARQLAAIDHLNFVPHEEILLQSTLWWEKNKLFGHCNELYALSSTSDGAFLASASKANRPDLASIIVWETNKFRKAATLEHHSLTITRLRFSPDDTHLLSVSRDRTWCLYERNPSGQLRNAYRKLVGTNKSNAVHERIIWDCTWTHDSAHFCTVSRDKKAILWSLEHLRSHPETSDLQTSIRACKLFDRSVQAVDSPSSPLEFCPSGYLLALGFEDGSLELHLLTPSFSSDSSCQFEWSSIRRIDNYHQLAIKRLTFRPGQRAEQSSDTSVTGAPSGRQLLLASGAEDCVLRLTQLNLITGPQTPA